MPRQPRVLHPERNTRVSSYQARIERTLTDIYTEVPAWERGSGDWTLVAVGHTHGHATCELCGHNPIRRLFWIKQNSTGRELMVGSECAVNYANADLVRGYMSRLQSEQNRNRTRALREAAYAERNARNEAIAAERRAIWANNIDREAITEFINTDLPATNRSSGFIQSLRNWLTHAGYLTEAQVTSALRIMRETPALPVQTPLPDPELERLLTEEEEYERRIRAVETIPAVTTPPVIRNCEAADLPNIADAEYLVADSHNQISYQIHTVQRGRLEGKRIIKVKVNGTYKGFAFLTTAPGLLTWRSAQEWITTDQKRFARAMVQIVAANSTGISQIVRTGIYNEVTYTVTRSNVVPSAAARAAAVLEAAEDARYVANRNARLHREEAARAIPEPVQHVGYVRRTPLAMSSITPTEIR